MTRLSVVMCGVLLLLTGASVRADVIYDVTVNYAGGHQLKFTAAFQDNCGPVCEGGLPVEPGEPSELIGVSGVLFDGHPGTFSQLSFISIAVGPPTELGFFVGLGANVPDLNTECAGSNLRASSSTASIGTNDEECGFLQGVAVAVPAVVPSPASHALLLAGLPGLWFGSRLRVRRELRCSAIAA